LVSRKTSPKPAEMLIVVKVLLLPVEVENSTTNFGTDPSGGGACDSMISVYN
jgi:hypothetical protein